MLHAKSLLVVVLCLFWLSPGQAAKMYVLDKGYGRILEWDLQANGFSGVLDEDYMHPVVGGSALKINPVDGLLYVSVTSSGIVQKFDLTTRSYVSPYIDLVGAAGFVFAPNGNMYIVDSVNNTLKVFNNLGTQLNISAPSAGSLFLEPYGVTWSGNELLVSSRASSTIDRFDSEGTFVANLVPSLMSQLTFPSHISLGPDGLLYVANTGAHNVLRLNPQTGAFVDVFADASDGVQSPSVVKFGPDGLVYIASNEPAPKVMRFNRFGNLVDLLFEANPSLLISEISDLEFDAPVPELNRNPECHNARAEKDILPPVTNKWAPVSVVGVTDPFNLPFSIKFTSIMQDEPTKGLFPRDKAPDGRIKIKRGASLAEIKQEVAADNGRMYSVFFTATNSQGLSCNGSVWVCITKSGSACVIEPTPYNSLK